jgi:hypothetical protein
VRYIEDRWASGASETEYGDVCNTTVTLCSMLNCDLNRSYVVGAIQADTSLPFDMSKLLELVKMEAGSWSRHRAWLIDAEKSGRGYCAPTESLSC